MNILSALCAVLFLRATLVFAAGIAQFVAGTLACLAACALWALGVLLGALEALWSAAFPKD